MLFVFDVQKESARADKEFRVEMRMERIATTVDARTKDTIQLAAAMIMLPAATVAEDDATAHLSSCNNNEKNGTLLMMSL